MGTRPRMSLVALLVAAAAAAAFAQQPGDDVVVPLSDPNRPALVKLDLVQGSVSIKGTNRRDVLIVSRSAPGSQRPPRDVGQGNLRRLTMPPGMEVSEERNEVTIDAGRPNRHIDFDIQVPARTNLKIQLVNGGGLTVEDVEGEIELENVNGPISVRQVSGSVVANTVNGPLRAVLNRIDGQKAMSFTSLNGPVDVTFPASLKANLRLRSDNGDVFTDFDMQVRQESPSTSQNRRGNGRLRIEVNKSIYGVVGGGGPEIELRSFNGNVFVRKGQ